MKTRLEIKLPDSLDPLTLAGKASSPPGIYSAFVIDAGSIVMHYDTGKQRKGNQKPNKTEARKKARETA